MSSEAYSRILIDKALEASNWDLSKEVMFEASSTTGRADYILIGSRGALCVIEAKAEHLDPYDAKEQARGYADNARAPFIILSNGKEHWFWNYTRQDQDAYRIERFPSKVDLERLLLKNLQPPRPLMSEVIASGYLTRFRHDLTVRGYQIKALDAVSKQFDSERKRNFLLEMATGTGKTLLCAALIRRFLTTRNAERVLFIVDRIELAKQTLEEFNVILAEYKPVLYKSARRRPMELMGSCVVVATLQSLMADRRYRREFTPFHFDLVINDEAHRSIYGDAREVVQFFQATRIGLTATPKAYLKNVDTEKLGQENPKALEARILRDTYQYFGCDPGFPTFRYDILDAVKDPEGPFLCSPEIYDLRSDITTKALEETGWAVTINEQEENYKIQDLERKIFTPARNQVMCETFLREALRDPAAEIGKSIVFAVNQEHATTLTKIFNALKPGIALTITSRVPASSDLAKGFRDGKRSERIAVSVDMLSTGYNCRDLLNIGLMRPIFSPTEYIQIKGRGTRLYTFKIGSTSYDKKKFRILDFCAVAEYFEEKYDYTVPLSLPNLSRGSQGSGGKGSISPVSPGGDGSGDGSQAPPTPPKEIPVWEGRDELVKREVIEVGPDGEKVDMMTFRGSYEKDLKSFVAKTPDLREAIEAEDDDAVETIMNEQFYHKPKMFYSPDKLILSYGVPATTPEFVYGVVGKKPLPSKDDIIHDTVDSIASRFNLRYSEQKWVDATAQLVAENPEVLKRFVEGDMTIFTASQFNQLGGVAQLTKFEKRGDVFEALRQSGLVRQTLLAVNYHSN